MPDNYLKKFEHLITYIDDNLNEKLSLTKLCSKVQLSKYHFHRQFSFLCGVNLHSYIKMQRFKQAVYQLAFRKNIPITDIALDIGYENPESFSRAFKELISLTPSQFRINPQWELWNEKYEPYNNEAILTMKTNINNVQVTITRFQETKVAALEHHGSPNKVLSSVAQFIEWRKLHGPHPSKSATYNIIYNDPTMVPSQDFRLDVCASINTDVLQNNFGVVTKTIPAGPCAVLRHKGSDLNLGSSLEYLYGQWLPTSGEQARDFPMFLHRVTMFPDVKENEAIIDIYLPLEEQTVNPL